MTGKTLLEYGRSINFGWNFHDKFNRMQKLNILSPTCFMVQKLFVGKFAATSGSNTVKVLIHSKICITRKPREHVY